jgi:hypothetical protein
MERDTDITVNLPRENYTKEGALSPTPIWSTRPHTPAFQPAVNRDPGKTGGSTGGSVYRFDRVRPAVLGRLNRFSSRNVGLIAGKTGGSTTLPSKPNRRFYRGVWGRVGVQSASR